MSNSVVCPSCGEKNNPSFAVCWKCKCVLDESKLAAQPNRVIMKKQTPSFIFAAIIGIGVVIIMDLFKVVNVSSPQQVTLSLRNTLTVAKGRAQVRLMPDVDRGKGSDEEETVGDHPVVDVKCGKKELHQIKLTDQLSDLVCGVQVRVLKVYKNEDYPRVDIEVVWK